MTNIEYWVPYIERPRHADFFAVDPGSGFPWINDPRLDVLLQNVGQGGILA